MRTARLVLLCSLSILSALCMPARVLQAQGTPTAAQHDEQARAYFRTGAFALAAQEFERAYALETKATRLYNAALAYEKAGEKRKATALYARYLAADPNGDKAVESRARKAALEQDIAKEEQNLAAENARAALAKQEQTLASAANELLGAGRYAEAAEAYEAAYQAGKNVQFIFEQAEALRLAGKSVAALASYRMYQQEAPQGASVDEARRRQDQLEAAQRLGHDATAPAPRPDLTADDSADAPGRPESHYTTLRWVGVASTGLGMASLGGSLILALRASFIESDIEGLEPAKNDAWSPDYEQKLRDGESAASTARTLAVVGGALAVGGVALFYVGGNETSERPAMSVVPTMRRDGGGLAVMGAF